MNGIKRRRSGGSVTAAVSVQVCACQKLIEAAVAVAAA